MQRRGAFPSLPAPTSQPAWNNAAPQAAFAMTAALTNPYGQASYGPGAYYSSHYAQAYMQPLAGSSTTPQGYSISSTYNPSASHYPPRNEIRKQEIGGSRPSVGFPTSHRTPSWYQAGNSRCTQANCAFTGSQKTVEVHMMDRHLIYPPGWEKRKKRDDWDTDPSLKGKPIPIQGTTVILDSPEVLESWIAERKKRWPSVQRVEEKKRKMDEAIARGQLPVDGTGFNGRKRQRTNESSSEKTGDNVRGGGRGTRNGRGRGNARVADAGWGGRGRGRGQSIGHEPRREVGTTAKNMPGAQASLPVTDPSPSDDSTSSSEEENDDELPEATSSKLPAEALTPLGSDPEVELHGETPIEDSSIEVVESQPLQPVRKPLPRQPKKLPQNPFASRTSLLHNFLLPEIRMTVSNLSQAIRFLVDNDFLENVELKPGQANEKLIQIINEDNQTI